MSQRTQSRMPFPILPMRRVYPYIIRRLLKAILELHPKRPTILVDDVLQVFAGSWIPVFLIHDVINVPGKFPPLHDPLTEQRGVENIEGAGVVSGECQARAGVAAFQSHEEF